MRFEAELAERTSLNNYEYLDVLDRAWSIAGGRRPERMDLLCDVGCASFWYAAALEAFFRPRALVGVDVEGYRLFKDGRSRSDYAAGYVGQRANARFVVADYLDYREPADLISAWFPFVTPGALLAWRLPLGLLRPERLMRRIRENLRPGGMFLMVNHGDREADIAAPLCVAAELRLAWRVTASPILGQGRPVDPVVSCWRRADETTDG